jgi:hypothetical protein
MRRVLSRSSIIPVPAAFCSVCPTLNVEVTGPNRGRPVRRREAIGATETARRPRPGCRPQSPGQEPAIEAMTTPIDPRISRTGNGGPPRESMSKRFLSSKPAFHRNAECGHDRNRTRFPGNNLATQFRHFPRLAPGRIGPGSGMVIMGQVTSRTGACGSCV